MNGDSVRSRFNRLVLAVLTLTVITAAVLGYWAAERIGFGHRANVLEVAGPNPVTIMAFSSAFSVATLPAGWHHRRFLSRTAMDLRVVENEGASVLRCATQNSASMLVRDIDAELTRHPHLEWRWLVEDGIDSPIDERTEAGDDHPIRLFLRFVDADGEQNAMEIIWANVHLRTGEWKFLGSFAHYVANGGVSRQGRWHDESVDLRDLYRKTWGDVSAVRLTEIALFCDSDETGDATTAYLQHIRLAVAAE
jgi:hypothetical protein